MSRPEGDPLSGTDRANDVLLHYARCDTELTMTARCSTASLEPRRWTRFWRWAGSPHQGADELTSHGVKLNLGGSVYDRPTQ